MNPLSIIKSHLQIVCAVILLSIFSYGYYKYTSLQTEIMKSKKLLEDVSTINIELTTKIDNVVKINDDNSKIIEQMKKDKIISKNSIDNLSIDIKKSNDAIDSILIDKSEPTVISPVLKSTIEQIQNRRYKK